MKIRLAEANELDELAAVAARCQAHLGRRIPYLDLEAGPLASEVVGTEPGPWHERTFVAVDGGRMVGWMLADIDPEMGRTWWNGPFVDVDVDDVAAAPIADALLGAFAETTPEQELSFDPSSVMLSEFAIRHGFTIVPGSAALAIELPAPSAAANAAVRELATDGERAAVAALHDTLFPATHTTGRVLASGEDDDRLTLGLFDGDELAGYVSLEHQPGQSMYIDYLGVEPRHRRRGYGAALVADALQRAADAGYRRAHLTVRISNTEARRLYESLHFSEEMLIAAARKGFALE